MAFCAKCGTPLNDSGVCPNCGYVLPQSKRPAQNENAAGPSAVSENQENHQETGAYSAGGNHRPADAEATATVGGQSYYGTPNMSGTSTGTASSSQNTGAAGYGAGAVSGQASYAAGTSGQPYTQGGQENANPAGGYGAGAQDSRTMVHKIRAQQATAQVHRDSPIMAVRIRDRRAMVQGRRDSPIMAVRIRDRRAMVQGRRDSLIMAARIRGRRAMAQDRRDSPIMDSLIRASRVNSAIISFSGF